MKDKSIDFLQVWNSQSVSSELEAALEIASRLVHEDIVQPQQGISNVTEWCKKEGCWQRLKERVMDLDEALPQKFKDNLISKDIVKNEKKEARSVQKIDDGIEAQRKVLKISGPQWRIIFQKCNERGIVTEKEAGIMKLASQIPNKIPSEKQSAVLIEVLEKAEAEGIALEGY